MIQDAKQKSYIKRTKVLWNKLLNVADGESKILESKSVGNQLRVLNMFEALAR